MQVSCHQRYRSLDSLRGLGAVTVVLYHFVLFLPDGWRAQIHSVDMSLFLASRFAVMLFFVLSGFVLALPYSEGRDPAYGPYLVRRVCRLYLPFAFAVLVALVLCLWLGGSALPMESKWLNSYWIAPVTAKMVASHLLMLGIHGEQSISLDGAIWSLIIEMRASILFVFLVMYVRRTGYAGLGAAILLAYIAGHIRGAMGDTSPHSAESVLGAVLLTLHYFPLFLMGIIAALRRGPLVAFASHMPKAGHVAVLAGLAALWGLIISFGLQNRGFSDIFYGLLGTYLIFLCIAFPKFGASLSGPVCLWLGDISYSLYLIHFPLLLGCFHFFYGKAPVGLILVLAVPIIFLSAYVMHLYIERPAMQLGRKLALPLGKPEAVPPQA